MNITSERLRELAAACDYCDLQKLAMAYDDIAAALRALVAVQTALDHLTQMAGRYNREGLETYARGYSDGLRIAVEDIKRAIVGKEGR